MSIDSNLIEVKEYQLRGRLPDPFALADGSRISKPEEWAQARKELYKTAVELQYGTMPPEPEFLKVELLDNAPLIHNYRITTGRKDCPVSFIMRIVLPAPEGKFPAIVDGDLCWR